MLSQEAIEERLAKNKEYWTQRIEKTQERISNKTINQVNKQLSKYYKEAAENCIDSFIATHEKILATIEAGREPTPADLYKLDKYWQMQGQLRNELIALGDKEIKYLSAAFETNFFDVYYSLGIEGGKAFNTIDDKLVSQMVNQIWCADGKTWSQRVWDNIGLLSDTLNEELIHTVATGKPTSHLKKVLQERFSVSFSAADSLVRTEVAHIQTQAAKQRYEDYGVQKVQIWADEDERRCEVCGKLHEKIYLVGDQIPIPAHPRCRCCIIPLVEV